LNAQLPVPHAKAAHAFDYAGNISPHAWELSMTAGARSVLERIGVFVEELQGVHFQVPEDDAAVARGALFAPRHVQRIKQGIGLLQAAQEHYERATVPEQEVRDADSLDDIGHLISTEIAGQEVTDLLFLARADLRGALQDLVASVDSEDFLRVASSCDAGLRTLKRTLISVESALHDFEGLEPPMRVWSDLEVSLQTRQLYAEIRREVLRPPAPDDGALPDRLASVHDRLDHLRELDVYPLLRFDDRVAMRELRRRISAWIVDETPDMLAGGRLWDDLVGFAQLLKAVSHREELRQHDRALLRRAYHQLFGRAAHARVLSDELLHQLATLDGLDDDLDVLLARGERSDLPRWREVMTRLLRRLSTPAEALAGAAWPE
jgi:hypothetical protein